MRQLTSLDAQFLALESANQTGHVTGLAILDPSSKESGDGNGPRYVQGPVTVTGSDPYGLDADGDGIVRVGRRLYAP